MSRTANRDKETFQLRTIGHIRREDDAIYLDVDADCRPALKELDQFSHVMVFWWADQFDEPEYRQMMQVNPPYAEEHLTGMFATRSPIRPNPLAMTTCTVVSLDVETGVLQIGDIDAMDGTPLVDLKAYFPVCDRVRVATIPEWLQGWPQWMPDEGVGLEPHEM